MEKQFFEDLGQYGIRVECESYKGSTKDSFHVTIGEFSFSFRGENKKNEIIVEYPFWNQYVFGEKVNIDNDDECKRFIEALIEIDQYMKGQSYTSAFRYEEKEKEEIVDMQDLLLCARKKGAVFTEEMDEFAYFGHDEESYEEDKLFVRLRYDMDGFIYGHQSDDGESSTCYCVFPNAEIVKLKKEYISIGEYNIHVLYAVLNKEIVHAHYPVEVNEKEEIKMIYDLEELEEKVKNYFEKTEMKRQNKGLTMYAYNWLQKFDEETLKERMQVNDRKQVESEKEANAENSVFVYSIFTPVIDEDDDLPF